MCRACVCLLFLSSCERREQSQKRWGKGQEECKCYPELWPLAKEKYTYKAKPRANVYRKLLIIYKLFRNFKCGVVGTHCPNPLPRSVCISMHRLKIWQLDLSLEIILVNSLAWLCSNAHDILCKPMNVSYTRKEKKKYLYKVQGHWNLKKRSNIKSASIDPNYSIRYMSIVGTHILTKNI